MRITSSCEFRQPSPKLIYMKKYWVVQGKLLLTCLEVKMITFWFEAVNTEEVTLLVLKLKDYYCMSCIRMQCVCSIWKRSYTSIKICLWFFFFFFIFALLYYNFFLSLTVQQRVLWYSLWNLGLVFFILTLLYSWSYENELIIHTNLISDKI